MSTPTPLNPGSPANRRPPAPGTPGSTGPGGFSSTPHQAGVPKVAAATLGSPSTPMPQGVGLATTPEPGEEQAGFRLDALAAAGMESLPDAPKRKVPMQLVLMAGLLVVAAGALLTMRKLGMGPVKSLGQVDISYDYNKKTATTPEHQRIISALTTDRSAPQVPAEQIHKNPFSLADANLGNDSAPSTPAPSGETPEAKAARLAAEKAARDAQAMKGQIENTLASLKIHGIMTGSTPVARVGEQTVRVGDKLAELFTVTAIRDRAVDLETADGVTYTISLDDQPRPAPRPSTPPRKP